MMGFYDGTNYWQFNTIADFIDHVISHKYRAFHIFAHFGGKYDAMFILDHLHRSCKEMAFSTITQGSKILSLKFSKGKNTWTLADSSGLFPNLSLQKLTKSFDVKHKKLSGSIDFKKGERVDKNNPEHQKYLEHDCKGLYEVIEKYLMNPKIKEEGFNLTAASQAMNMWRRTIKTDIRVTPQEIQDFCRQGYYGGRTEIFKMKGQDLKYYDVTSLYPFVMRSNRFPTEMRGESTQLSDRLGFFDCDITAPDNYIPILPTRHDRKLIFANGTFRGVFYSEELKLALEHGYQINKIHRGIEFFESRDLFSEYIDYWFEQKNNALKGSALELIAKLFLNGLYGKFGQKEERLTLKTWEGERNYIPFHSHDVFERTGLIEVAKWHRAPYMLSHIAAAVTSYGRMHMARLCYLDFPSECFYTDTDSILTRREMAVGPRIGDLKEVDKGLDGIFKRPKAYFLEKDGIKVDSKIKGFSKDFVETLTREDFERFKPVENLIKPCTVKTSIVRNGSYLSKLGFTKSIQSEYSKRRILRDGETEPWILRNGIIINQEKKHV